MKKIITHNKNNKKMKYIKTNLYKLQIVTY